MIRGYTRVSTMEQVAGTSLASQRETIERAHPGAVYYTDEGVSGSVPLGERSAGEELLADLQPGDTVVAAKLDRLFRNATDALVMAERFERQGVKLVLLDISRDAVNAGGVGKLIFTVLAAVAEMERTRIAERVKEGRRAKRARGGSVGGVAPFGWRVEGQGKEATLVADPAQQAALQTIRQGKEAGLSLRQLSELVKMTHNLSVSHVAVSRIVKEGRYGNG
jgi:putative DNA-invertase from lambdoid prophage Rac